MYVLAKQQVARNFVNNLISIFMFQFISKTSTPFVPSDVMEEYQFNDKFRILVVDNQIWDICVQKEKDCYYEVEYTLIKENAAIFEYNNTLHLILFENGKWWEKILAKIS